MIDLLTVAGGALLNAAVVWGVVRTEMKYLRRDTDSAHSRIDALVAGRCPTGGHIERRQGAIQ